MFWQYFQMANIHYIKTWLVLLLVCDACLITTTVQANDTCSQFKNQTTCCTDDVALANKCSYCLRVINDIEGKIGCASTPCADEARRFCEDESDDADSAASYDTTTTTEPSGGQTCDISSNNCASGFTCRSSTSGGNTCQCTDTTKYYNNLQQLCVDRITHGKECTVAGQGQGSCVAGLVCNWDSSAFKYFCQCPNTAAYYFDGITNSCQLNKVSSVNISKSPQTPHAASTVTLTCASDSSPPATYTWVKVDDENRELSAVMEGTESKLTLTDLNPTTDSGEYRCTASNSYNNNNFSKSQSIHLEILPRAPEKFPVRYRPLSGSSSGEITTKCTGTGCEIDSDEVVITKERGDNDGDDKYIWMGSVIGCSFLISVSIIVFLMWKYRLPKRLPASWCTSVAAPQQPTRLLPVEKTTKLGLPPSDPANNTCTCTCTKHGKNGVLRNSTENGVCMLAKPFTIDTGSEGYFIDMMSSPASSPHTDSHGYLVLSPDTSDPAQMTSEPETPLLGAITYRMLRGKIRATAAPQDEPHIYDEIDII